MLSNHGTFSFNALRTFLGVVSKVLCVLVLQNCQSKLNVISDSEELPAASVSASELRTQEENSSPITESSGALSTSRLLDPTTISQGAAASQSRKASLRTRIHTSVSTASSDMLSAAQQEEVIEREYAELPKQQENFEKEAHTALRARVSGLSKTRAPEQRQRQTARLSVIAFGASAWEKYYGKVNKEPPLPDNIEDILNGPCPFWGDRIVRDTHFLVLIPAKVNGQPFSLNLLNELIQNPLGGGHRTEYRWYDEDVQNKIGAASPQVSYWLLMTREILPESRSKNYEAQQKLVIDHANRTGLPYKLPRVLEASTAILTHHVRSEERLYTDNPWTYTRCQELISDKSSKYPVVVGGFAYSGLDVYDVDYGSHDSIGVAGCRKL